MPRLTIGLTGGIATGKSAVADRFLSHGVPLLDADLVARQVVEPGTPALKEIVAAFGTSALDGDGRLDRRAMRERVFADDAARRQLEKITHPRIRESLLAWRDAQTAPYAVIAVPILVEMGLDADVDRVLVVDAPEATQLQRLRERDGIPERLARQMLAAQAPRAHRLARADDVIRNDGGLDAIGAAVAQLHAFYSQLADSGRTDAPGLHLP